MGRQRAAAAPAAAGPSGETGWEALDKWVGSGAAAAPAAAGPSGKTGWEALDKWVGSGAAAAPAAAGPSGKTGWEALDKWVGSEAATTGPSGKTGWEALDKWVGSGAAAAPAAAGPSGKTGWEALDKWVGSGAAAAPEAPHHRCGAGGTARRASSAGCRSDRHRGEASPQRRLLGLSEALPRRQVTGSRQGDRSERLADRSPTAYDCARRPASWTRRGPVLPASSLPREHSVFALNFYSPLFIDQLRNGRRRRRFGSGDKSHKYRSGQIVWITVGHHQGPKQRIFTAMIEQVERQAAAGAQPTRH